MIAKSLITDMVPPVLANESCEKALIWMDEFKVAHLPVVDGKTYIGLVSDDLILDSENDEALVSELNLISHRPFVFETQHVYEVMKVMADLKLTVIPILDAQENYVGLTTIQYIMYALTNMAALEQSGAVIVIAMNENDYSMSHLAQIVESNNAKILSSYVSSEPDSTRIELTLKINQQEIGSILQSLYRHEYEIVETYAGNKFEDDLQERFDAFIKFMNI